jgi:alpha-D-xyloside xylohydrolase
MLNAYSLVNSQAIFEGQVAAAPNQRVFMLTRNGFAGQQRYAAASWSGDITSTWTAMRKQVPAGLSFSVSGMPYWTLDSGGFAPPARFSATNPTGADTAEWRELNTRWFEYATFLPLMRVARRGATAGNLAVRRRHQPGLRGHAEVRSAALPVAAVHLLAGWVILLAGPVPCCGRWSWTSAPRLPARDIVDQYMFGPAFLVSPVTTYNATTLGLSAHRQRRLVRLLDGKGSGGRQTVQADAAFDSIPVYVRAGSIVPIGPELQYAAEKAADPITLYVYAGADGAFTLYEDQGLTYDYQQGAFSEIPLRWTDSTHTLSIGARQGTFSGILSSRSFQVVLVSATKAVGFSFTPTADKTVTYTGAAQDVTFN